MSRYRKIEVRTWSDQKFRNLTPLPASGQSLWFFLLTGPHTSPIPGLFRAGRAAMAEELGWELEAFDKAFAEVSTQGMAKADFKAKLVWLPNAIRHNKPESPNVVRSWRVEFDVLPECALKHEAIAFIRNGLKEVGTPYESAFEELFSTKEFGLTKPNAKAKPKPSAKAMPNQEQEQEQEQETSSCLERLEKETFDLCGENQNEEEKIANAEKSKTETPTPPPVIAIPLIDGSEFGMSEGQVAEWSAAYPAVDVLQTLRAIRQWAISNPQKRKTRRGVMTHCNGWLAREQDKPHPEIFNGKSFKSAKAEPDFVRAGFGSAAEAEKAAAKAKETA